MNMFFIARVPDARVSDAGNRHRHPRWIAAAMLTIAAALLWPAASHAMPAAPAVVCDTYPDAVACVGTLPSCNLCHTSPPARNDFGAAIAEALLPGAPRPLDPTVFADELPDALKAVEAEDSDGDGFSNLEELLAGSLPSAIDSTPMGDGDAPVCEQVDTSVDGWQYNVCERDTAYTFAKVMRDVCGRSPTIDELDSVIGAVEPWEIIHDTLDGCLDSQNWLGINGVLWNMANSKIKPSASLKAGNNAGDIPLGDFEDDYNLFIYSQIDDRDAREMLTAQYMVTRADGDDATVYLEYVREPFEDFLERGFAAAQLSEPETRAGMITTRWFLVNNTMFTAVPRTSAAQAYRAYLGMDIAKLEGLMPVDNEPIDYDDKDVDADDCAVCHSTLDAITYPFTRYEGLGNALPGVYNANRMNRMANEEEIPTIADTPEAGVLLGQPVANLLEWADVAANSDAFARNTVLDYWRHFIGEEPTIAEQAQFDALWQDFASVHEYGVERMIHALIETEAYSVP